MNLLPDITQGASSFPLLTLLVAIPAVGGLVCFFLRRHAAACRWLSLISTLVVLALSVVYFVTFSGQGGWLLYEDYPWIERFGIRYTLGLDGISLLMILLTALTQVLAILVSWRRTFELPLFFATILFMEAGILGVFLALDLFLFYLFWEVMVIPMFFLIGVYGHGRRVYAAVKFFLYTMGGSLLMLLGIIALVIIHAGQTGEITFSLPALQGTVLSPETEWWLYGAFLIAFIIKVPLVPFHTWLPDAHTEAPTAGSLDLAGLLLKTGMYGLIRIAFPLFPVAAQASLPFLAVLAIVGIFYAAWIAFAQLDAKRLIAYSSVSHVGLMVLGLCAWNQTAVEGSILQMFNHGITTGALFIMVGMIQHRAHTRDLDSLSGLWAKAPILSAFFLFFALSSLGLPGLNNFVGEILILIGAFQANPWWGILGMAGVVFAAAYTLRLVKETLWGPPDETPEWQDLTPREYIVLVPLAALVLWVGVYPAPFLEPIREPVRLMLEGGIFTALNGGTP